MEEGIPQGMEVVVIILLILAAVCFGAAALKTVARWELVPLGLLFWVLAVLIPAIADNL
jgi:purine-cytosine permease-like protein